MNRLSKSLLFATLLLAAAGVAIEHRSITAQRTQLAARDADAARLEGEARAQRETLVQTQRGLAAIDQEAARARATLAEAEASSSMRLWANRITLLKRLLDEMPGQSIPELRLLTPTDWVQIARAHELDSAGDIRTALAALRSLARTKFAPLLQEALKKFIAGSGGELPTDVLQLAPHLAPPAATEMLRRYAMVRSGRVGATNETLIRENAEGDLILSVGLETYGLNNNSAWKAPEGETKADTITRAAAAISAAFDQTGDPLKLAGNASPVGVMNLMEKASTELEALFGNSDAFGDMLKTAVKKFNAAKPGEPVTDMAQLLPYLEHSPELIAMARPFFAQLNYLRDHQGQAPTDPAQLREYLAQPFHPEIALRTIKVTTDGEHVTVNISSNGP